MKNFYLILILLIASLNVSAQDMTDEELDSLARIYYTYSDRDTAKINICNEIAIGHYNSDSTIAWSKRLIALADIQDNAFLKAKALYYINWAYYKQDNYLEGNKCTFEALAIADSIDNKSLIAKLYVNIGDNYSCLLNYDLSDDYYMKALEIYQTLSDSLQIGYVYSSLAANYYTKNMFDKAIELYDKALDIYESCSDVTGDDIIDICLSVSKCYNDYFYRFSSDPDRSLLEKAKFYIFKALQEETYSYNAYALYCILEDCLVDEVTYFHCDKNRRAQIADSVLMFHDFADSVVAKFDSGSDIFTVHFMKADYLWLNRNYKACKALLDSIKPVIMSEPAFDYMISPLYCTYYSLFNDMGNMDSACYYKSKFYEYNLKATSPDYAVKTTQNLAQNEFNELIRRREEREAHHRRIVIYIWIGGMLIFLIVIWEYIRKRRHNAELNSINIALVQQREEILSQKEEILAQSEELQIQNQQIMEQNESIKTQHKQITDSINYASLIQQAVLPKDELMQELFRDYFVIYRPLNVVAGDYYWASRLDKYSILVCADCTGHGVPGAFVSMLGVSLLNETVPAIVFNHGNAADILNELRQKLMNALGQSRELYREGKVRNMDGMDLSLVMIDYEAMKMQFAGAYRPLWLHRDNQIIEYKPDKMPIGIYLGDDRFFTNHVIDIKPNDVLYMFSDGIPDQFGYLDDTKTKCKHFSTKKLMALLTELGNQPMQQQRQIIEDTIDKWKNGYKQLDDNILIGVRI
ncbi:MAG: SpoIIE family protein phosphatase [Bacteroidales bacterium]|nr:SpoIIE family protein phosphatase [Bacteroidales bacterium]